MRKLEKKGYKAPPLDLTSKEDMQILFFTIATYTQSPLQRQQIETKAEECSGGAGILNDCC